MHQQCITTRGNIYFKAEHIRRILSTRVFLDFLFSSVSSLRILAVHLEKSEVVSQKHLVRLGFDELERVADGLVRFGFDGLERVADALEIDLHDSCFPALRHCSIVPIFLCSTAFYEFWLRG